MSLLGIIERSGAPAKRAPKTSGSRPRSRKRASNSPKPPAKKKGRTIRKTPPADAPSSPSSAEPQQTASSAPPEKSAKRKTVRSKLWMKEVEIGLPLGFKGKEVVYQGLADPLLPDGTRLLAGLKRKIVSAFWFFDCLGKPVVMFRLVDAKNKTRMRAFPQDLKIGRKDLRRAADAMLKYEGIE